MTQLKKVVTTLILVGLLCPVSWANTRVKNNFFLSSSLGTSTFHQFYYQNQDNQPTKSNHNSSSIELTTGYKISNNINVALNYSTLHGIQYLNETVYGTDRIGEIKVLDSQELSAKLFSTSLCYKLGTVNKLSSNIFTGIGMARIKVSDFIHKVRNYSDIQYKQDLSKQVVWNIGADIIYKLNDEIDLEALKYSYDDLGTMVLNSVKEIDETANIRLKVHSIKTGIKIKF